MRFAWIFQMNWAAEYITSLVRTGLQIGEKRFIFIYLIRLIVVYIYLRCYRDPRCKYKIFFMIKNSILKYFEKCCFRKRLQCCDMDTDQGYQEGVNSANANANEGSSLAITTKSPMFGDVALSPDEEQDVEWLKDTALIGRVVCDSLIDPELVIKATQSWELSELVMVSVLGLNMFQFEFGNPEDKRKTWENRPWSIAGQQLVLGPWREDFSILNHDLYHTVIWVQAKGLQAKFYTHKTAQRISERLHASLLEVDIPDGFTRSQIPFLRFKVRWDTRNPFVAGLPAPQSDGSKAWIVLQYERLSSFCFSCGRLGHEPRNCKFDQVIIPFPTGPVLLKDVAFDMKAIPKHYAIHVQALIPITTMNFLKTDQAPVQPEGRNINQRQTRTSTGTRSKSSFAQLHPPPGFSTILTIRSDGNKGKGKGKLTEDSSHSYVQRQPMEKKMGYTPVNYTNPALGVTHSSSLPIHIGTSKTAVGHTSIQDAILSLEGATTPSQRYPQESLKMINAGSNLGVYSSGDPMLASYRCMLESNPDQPVLHHNNPTGNIVNPHFLTPQKPQKITSHKMKNTKETNNQNSKKPKNSSKTPKKPAVTQTTCLWARKDNQDTTDNMPPKKRMSSSPPGPSEPKKLCFMMADCRLMNQETSDALSVSNNDGLMNAGWMLAGTGDQNMAWKEGNEKEMMMVEEDGADILLSKDQGLIPTVVTSISATPVTEEIPNSQSPHTP